MGKRVMGLVAGALLVLGCTDGDLGWRQTQLGDGLGPSIATGRCWIIRWEDGARPGTTWIDTVFPSSTAFLSDALPGNLRAGDVGSFRGEATPEWKAFSGDSAHPEVNRRFEVLHVCGEPPADLEGALAAHARADRPWRRWGATCWCAPAPPDSRPWSRGESVVLRSRTSRWPHPEGEQARNGHQEFHWGDEDQLLPTVHAFLSAHPAGGMLVCPVGEALGPAGLPEVGWLPEETVVFDLAVQRPDSMAH
jgi:hypothetical protein